MKILEKLQKILLISPKSLFSIEIFVIFLYLVHSNEIIMRSWNGLHKLSIVIFEEL